MVQHAAGLIEEDSSRNRTVSRDPASQTQRMTDEDIASLRKRHKFLEDFSDTFIRNTPVGDLMKIETTAIKLKDWEKNKDADDRLSINKSALSSTFSDVSAGRDNRLSVLHPARFLGGAGCSATKLWLAARESLGTTGHPPIGSYDLGAVGLAGYVSAKGWTECHNLQNPKILVKYFNINNCSARASSKRTSEDPEDIMEVAELKLALRVMRTAFSFAQPWNFSVLALEGFFLQNNFCASDLEKIEKKTWFLSRFCDYAMAQNADRWRDAEPFLTTGDLKTLWASFFGAQPKSVLSSSDKGRQKDKERSKNSKQAISPAQEARIALGICFAYNMGVCTKKKGDCQTKTGRVLKHVCDHLPDPAKPTEICGKEHVRKDVHK